MTGRRLLITSLGLIIISYLIWLAVLTAGYQPYNCPTDGTPSGSACSSSFVSRAVFPFFLLAEFVEKHQGFLTAALTLVLAVATVGLVYATNGLKQATDKLWKTAESSERALLVVKVDQVSHYNAAIPQIAFKIVNVGRSHAIIDDFYARLLVMEEPAGILEHSAKYIWPHNRILAGDETSELLSLEAETGLERQTTFKKLYFFGRVMYRDRRNIPHGHEFLWCQTAEGEANFRPLNIRGYNKDW